MPTVAIVNGIAVMFFYNDHDPPHAHLRSARFDAKFDLGDLFAYDVTGRMTGRDLRALRAWATAHRAELFENWVRARRKEPLVTIEAP